MQKVLVVFNSFYTPSMAHHRLFRLCRYLPRYGYEPFLLTEVCRHEPFSGMLPVNIVRQVPYFDLQHVYARLQRLHAFNEAGPAQSPKIQSRSIGLTTFLNRWFIVPDKQILWKRPALRAAVQWMDAESFDLVFASCMPATNGLVGAAVSKKCKIPFVVEYRDVWTGSPYQNLTQPTGFHRALNVRKERFMLRNASAVACLSAGIRDRLVSSYQDVLPGEPEVHYNAYDACEFISAGPQPERYAAFTLSYIGSMYLSRNPGLFFEAMRMFVEKQGLGPEEFRFRWTGAIVGINSIEAMLHHNRIHEYVDYLGSIPHEQALNELRRSHASLLIQSPDDTIHIAGKLFEAMGAGTPVFALANPCEVTQIIDKSKSGIHCPHDRAAVVKGLEDLWRWYKSGSEWSFNLTEVAHYSVDSTVKKMANLFDRACMLKR